MESKVYETKLKLLGLTNMKASILGENQEFLFKNLKINLDIVDITEDIYTIFENNGKLFSDVENIIMLGKLRDVNNEFADIRKSELVDIENSTKNLEEIKIKTKEVYNYIETQILEKLDIRTYLEVIGFGNEEFFNYVESKKRYGKTKLLIKEKDNILEDFYITVEKDVTKESRLDEIKCYLKAFYLYKFLNKEVKTDFDLNEEILLAQTDYLEYCGLINSKNNKIYKKI